MKCVQHTTSEPSEPGMGEISGWLQRLHRLHQRLSPQKSKRRALRISDVPCTEAVCVQTRTGLLLSDVASIAHQALRARDWQRLSPKPGDQRRTPL